MVGGHGRATTSISANGRYVAFVAIPLADPSNAQVYLYDRQTRQSTAVAVRPDGSPANGGSGAPNVSRSGNYFGFCSTATDLVPGRQLRQLRHLPVEPLMKINVRTTALVAALAGLGVVAAPAQALAPSGGTLTQITASTAEQGEIWGNGR